MKKAISATVVIIILLLSFKFFNKNPNATPQLHQSLKIGEITLSVEVADNDAKRIQGLSGKVGLGENEAMLFVFEAEGYHGIWMKDMNFPIDIAWLDKDKKIVYIEQNASPQTYPKVFYALKDGKPALESYVLETRAGFFEKSGIKIGDRAEFLF